MEIFNFFFWGPRFPRDTRAYLFPCHCQTVSGATRALRILTIRVPTSLLVLFKRKKKLQKDVDLVRFARALYLLTIESLEPIRALGYFTFLHL